MGGFFLSGILGDTVGQSVGQAAGSKRKDEQAQWDRGYIKHSGPKQGDI